jgi:6-phosphogluconolactonase
MMDDDQTGDDQGEETSLPPQQARPRHAVEVVPDAASLAPRATEWLVEQIAHAVARRGRAVLSLSGGTTPKAVFEMLARSPWRERIEWDKLHVFWGDERFVAADDPASNVRMTHAALLDHVDMPAAHIYPIPSDDGPFDGDVEAIFARAQSAASLYATTLHAFYGGDKLKDDQPLFDVVMLGLGEDGHTASLFPGTPALDEHAAWTAAVKTDNATAPVRITMTYPLIESTHAVLFLVAGEGKRAIVKRVLDGDESLPAARVHPHGGTLWIIDQAAGGKGDAAPR